MDRHINAYCFTWNNNVFKIKKQGKNMILKTLIIIMLFSVTWGKEISRERIVMNKKIDVFSVDLDFIFYKMWEAEHSHKRNKVLHKVKGEKELTIYGIYPYTKLKYHYVIDVLLKNNTVEETSVIVSKSKLIQKEVREWYIKNFYLPLGLDKITSRVKRAELMVFFMNVGLSKTRRKKATRYIQALTGAKVDGIWGRETERKLNEYPSEKFSIKFDEFERNFYTKWLTVRYPSMLKYLKGLIRRTKIV